AGVRVPSPIAVRKNVLVMEFVGDREENAAQQLVNTEVTPKDYEHVIEQLSLLYKKANLVHADLSEYNIFRADGGIMFFDFGSAVDIKQPNSKRFLVRDIQNVNRFFEKRGIKVIDASRLIEKITGASK
ncbi:MAG TPA: RIO1 family regulatory kinase/ATPase, partial [Nitrososphaera sp.]